MPVLLATAAVVALAAAARSTWSPCGWSMLSTLTPLSERSRGHRFDATAAWFVGGALVGGLALGTSGAALALVVASLDPSDTMRLLAAGLVVLAAAALDARVLRPALPHHRRQVNEDWLDEFRPWVYAAGFGAQIGSGLATYIMTGGVYALVGLAALTGSAPAALSIGVIFGVSRGLAVLAGRGNTDPARLAAFHRRFAALDEPVRRATVTVLGAGGVVLLASAAGATDLVSLVPVVALVAAVGVVERTGAAGQSGAMPTRDSAVFNSTTELDRRTSEPTTA